MSKEKEKEKEKEKWTGIPENGWINCPEKGWTVRTLVKALTSFDLDTPVYIKAHTDFGAHSKFSVEYEEKELKDFPADSKKGPLILLD